VTPAFDHVAERRYGLAGQHHAGEQDAARNGMIEDEKSAGGDNDHLQALRQRFRDGKHDARADIGRLGIFQHLTLRFTPDTNQRRQHAHRFDGLGMAKRVCHLLDVPRLRFVGSLDRGA
jgi:hypothetical protein